MWDVLSKTGYEKKPAVVVKNGFREPPPDEKIMAPFVLRTVWNALVLARAPCLCQNLYFLFKTRQKNTKKTKVGLCVSLACHCSYLYRCPKNLPWRESPILKRPSGNHQPRPKRLFQVRESPCLTCGGEGDASSPHPPPPTVAVITTKWWKIKKILCVFLKSC